MLPRKPKLIAFDLDGTLVDSSPDLAYSVDRMLECLGRPAAGETRVKGWIGNGVSMLVKRALTGEMHPAGKPAAFDEALALFMEIYQANVCERSLLYPGVAEGVAAVKAAGYPTACITNKASRFTLPLLEQLGVLKDLDFVGCGDQFSKHKPDPEPLLKTAEHFGVAPAECMMVGDSANDVQAARNAGYMVVCVPYGYSAGLDVAALGADGVIDSIADLPQMLAAVG